MDFFGVCILYSVCDVILGVSGGMGPVYFSCIPTLSLDAAVRPWLFAVYSGWKSVDKYDTCASVFVVLFNGFMSLTSYFDEKYRY